MPVYNEKKHTLIVTANYVTRGGVESFLDNWITQGQKDEYDFVWYFPCKNIDKLRVKEFENKGVVLVSGELNYQTKGIKKIRKLCRIRSDIKKILTRGHFDIIHVNTGGLSLNAIALKQAKKENVCIRIAHSHSAVAFTSNKLKKVIYTFFRWTINSCATKKVACSKSAAEALFGREGAKDATIVKNVIDIQRFAFSENNRRVVREKFGLENCFVMGQIARLSFEKNQKFLIDIFYEVLKEDNTARLLLVGEGPLENELRKYISDLEIERFVIFAGTTDRPEEFYSAMDVFVLPSLYEGLPITGIEAQAAGLPCVFSDGITQEVMLTNDCKFFSHDMPVDKWACEILSFKHIHHSKRESAYKIVEKKGYGVSYLGQMIKALYENTSNSICKEN